MLKKRMGDPNQLSIFDVIKTIEEKSLNNERPGSLNLDVVIREELSLAIKECPQSRYWIAGRMAELTGCPISKEQLDSWTSESHVQHNFPLKHFVALIKATGSNNLLKIIVERAGYHLAEDECLLDQELGKIKRLKEDLAQREKAIMGYLKDKNRKRE